MRNFFKSRISTEAIAEKKNVISAFFNSFIGKMLFFAIPGLVVGGVFGMRGYEVGASIKGISKGSTVYITGTCQVNGKNRNPAFARDQIIITDKGDKVFSGVILKTREHVECEASRAVLDTLPLFSEFSTSPEKPLELALPVIEIPKPDSLENLLDKKMTVTGTCYRPDNGSQEALSDDVVVFKNSSNVDGKTIISGIIVTEGKKKGILVSCDKMAVTIDPFVERLVDEKTVVAKGEVDLRGTTVLVTSTCFPDDKFEAPNKKEQLYYTFNDSPVKVMSYKKDASGEVIYLRGISLEKKKAIVCDQKNYEISVRVMTNDMKLIPIDSNNNNNNNNNNKK